MAKYMSLASALNEYPANEVVNCKDIGDLVARGYRYVSVKDGGGAGTYTYQDGNLSHGQLVKPPDTLQWDKFKDEIPTLLEKNATCDGAQNSIEYGFKWEDSYFHAEKVNWFGGSVGKPVFFEKIGINKKNPTKGFEVKTNSDVTLVEINSSKAVFVGTSDDKPIVAFENGEIFTYVDVEVRGSSQAAKIFGSKSQEVTFPEKPAGFEEDFTGEGCS